MRDFSWVTVAALLCATMVVSVTVAQSASGTEDGSPLGRWQAFDIKTHELRSIVEITAVGERLQGQVIKRFPPPADPTHGICSACAGERKDKPILGMVILWDLRRQGDGWGGGTVIDPATGRTYGAEIHLSDGGKTLLLRGYAGIPLLGQTVAWRRDSAR